MRKDILDSYTNLDPAKVHVVKNGIDTEEFKPDPGADVVTALGIDLDKPSVVFVGRITRQKVSFIWYGWPRSSIPKLRSSCLPGGA